MGILRTILSEIRSLKTELSINNLANKEMMTLKDTSIFTGLSESSLYKLTASKAIKFYKPNGKKIYFKRTDLDEFLLSNRILSNEDIEDEVSNFLLNLKSK